jgi:hypothetical protein
LIDRPLSILHPVNRLTDFQRGTLTASGNNGATFDSVSTPNGSWRIDCSAGFRAT